MITTKRAWRLLAIALPIAGIIIIFFSGLFPIEELFSFIPNTQLTASVSSVQVVSLTNENREDDNLPVLTTSPLLTEAAQLKAEDMAANSYYAHISPDGKAPLYWLDIVGYHYLNAGENLVIDRTTSEEVVDAWMNSKDHRENILRPQFTEIGVGVANGVYKGQKTIYVVQEFGTPYPNPQLVRKPTPNPIPLAANNAIKAKPQATQQPFKPQRIHSMETSGTSSLSTPSIPNVLLNDISVLTDPVIDTIKVRSSKASSTPAIPQTTREYTFTLPAQSDTVVPLSGSGIRQPEPPISDYQSEAGKRRVELVRNAITSLWTNIMTFVF